MSLGYSVSYTLTQLFRYINTAITYINTGIVHVCLLKICVGILKFSSCLENKYVTL